MDSEYENLKKNKIDLFVIDSEFLNILLFSYRYCLNELNSNNINSIYSFLYNKKNIQNINQYYYPGNDIKNIPIYELYSKIDNHFNKKIKYGCFVCLCKKGYYHSVNEEEPNEYLNQKCKECGEPIGIVDYKVSFFSKKIIIIYVKRDKYFRIFKEEILEQREINYNYMTIDDFKKIYIEKNFMEEKGIAQIDEDYLKKDNKIIRNLSQVSYRLLNFILYSHLFFAKLYTENKKFDNFLPKNMNWKKILTECWELLKIELNKNNISTIEVFMNYIFFDIFTELNQQSKINDYQTFIDFEKKLDNMIQKKMTDFKEEYKSIDKLKNFDNNDKFSTINLLEERFQEYNDSEYPFYIHFYYSDYLNEDYLLEKLNHYEYNKYPVLRRYLDHINSSTKNNKYSLDYLNRFNKILN